MNMIVIVPWGMYRLHVLIAAELKNKLLQIEEYLFSLLKKIKKINKKIYRMKLFCKPNIFCLNFFDI